MSKYAQIICINYATDNYLKLNPFQQFIFWVENNSYFTWVEIIKLKEVGIRSAVQEWTRQQVYLVGNVKGSYMYSTKVVVEGGGQVRYSQLSSKEKKRKKESGHFASNPQNRFETFQKLSNPSQIMTITE